MPYEAEAWTISMAPESEFDDIEAEIEVLRARLDTYRQAIALARAAIWLGGLTLALVLTVAGNYRTPAIVFGAFTAVLAGTVWFGATSTSRGEAQSRLADAEARRARLFDTVAARNGWIDLTPTVH